MELKFKLDNHVQYHDNVREVINEIIKKNKQATPLLHVVYIGLYSFNFAGVNNCHPSLEAIGNKMGMSKSTVSRCVKMLAENGVIIIRTSYDIGTNKVFKNYYFPLEHNLLSKKGFEEFDSIIGECEEWDNFYEKHVKPLLDTKKEVKKKKSSKLKDYEADELF